MTAIHTETGGRAGVTDVDPSQVGRWLEAGEAALIDVREPFEHAAERIEGAHHHALSTFDPAALPEARGRRLIFQCRTGSRSRKAAEIFCASRNEAAFNLAGGIEAWKRAGLPTKRAPGAPKLDIMRQVQVTAGAMVLTGVLLGAFISPWFLILSGFVGGGLMFAGLSGWCGMAKLLAAMPWNRTGRAAGA